jgi:hypothetical protein
MMRGDKGEITGVPRVYLIRNHGVISCLIDNPVVLASDMRGNDLLELLDGDMIFEAWTGWYHSN